MTTISIDFDKDYSQLCSWHKGKSQLSKNIEEPESISTIKGEDRYQIPTVLGKLKGTNNWCVGEEAVLRGNRGETENIFNLFKIINDKKNLKIGEQEYTPIQIIKIFFNKLLEIVYRALNCDKINKLVVTIEQFNKDMVDILYLAFEEIGFNKEDIRVISHSESFIYYTIFQKKTLWVNDVVVFNFNKYQFTAKRLNLVRARSPQPIVVEEYDFSDKISYGQLENQQGKKDADDMFIQVINQVMDKHIVSTVYLTGCGFYEKWMEQSINTLCNKKRVFQGYNFFVKGGAYATVEMENMGNCSDYQFVCVGRTILSFTIHCDIDDLKKEVCLSKSGTNWYEAGAIAEGFINNNKKILLNISSDLNRNISQLVIDLNNFPDRPQNTTRVLVTLAYKDEKTCIIEIRDLGFGDFYKASGEKVEIAINVEEYFLQTHITEENIETCYFKLCSRRQVSPYVIKDRDISIYSIEELAYYINNYVYFIDNSFFNDDILEYIIKFFNFPKLNEKIAYYSKNKTNPSGIIMSIVEASGYYNKASIEELKNTLEIIETKSMPERMKARADMLYKCGKLLMAKNLYLDILDRCKNMPVITEDIEKNKFFGELYCGLGKIKSRMFYFPEAIEDFKKSYIIYPEEDTLKYIVYSSILYWKNDGDTLSIEEIQKEFNITDAKIEEYKLVVEKESSNIVTTNEYVNLSEKFNYDGLCNLEDYYSEIQEILCKWKQEYREQIR